MKGKAVITLLLVAPFLSLAPNAVATTTWYVNGVSGRDSNNCKSATTACKTIGHVISRAASGDSVLVAAATYKENLTIGRSLTIVGARAATTIIDGGGISTVVTISSTNAHVILSRVSLRNGYAQFGGGIYNSGTLTVDGSILTANRVLTAGPGYAAGGGIYNNRADLTINNSTISGNAASANASGGPAYAYGGGIENEYGTLTINDSTISGNSASAFSIKYPGFGSSGGGIENLDGAVEINNSTLSGNTAGNRIVLFYGGGIWNSGTLTLHNSTVSGNSARVGGGIYGSATLQNSIVANSSTGGNCNGTVASKGYNLSSDGTCSLNGPGDIQNTDPLLGPLQNNGGPTQTMALLPGSPAIDAGNPSGCTDGLGHLLKTDQRGLPRPDTEDTGGCDMGAYERQSD